MRRLILLLFCLIFCFTSTGIASYATPTDLKAEEYEEYAYFEDGDPGYINIELERKVYIVVDKQPEKIGDEVTLIAVLVDFHPNDIITFHWETAIRVDNELIWSFIEDEHEQTYTFIFDEDTMFRSYRVIVEVEEIK